MRKWSQTWNSDPVACLCARGNASAAFTDDLKALEAARAFNEWLFRDEQAWQRWREEDRRHRRQMAIALAAGIAIVSPSPYCPPYCSSAGRAGAGCAAVRTQNLA